MKGRLSKCVLLCKMVYWRGLLLLISSLAMLLLKVCIIFFFRIVFLLFAFVAAIDYTAVATQISFEASFRRRCVKIALLVDDILEPIEYLNVTLLSDDVYIVLLPDVATLHVLDASS